MLVRARHVQQLCAPGIGHPDQEYRAGTSSLERWYATRANSHKVEIAGASHVVYAPHAKEVADVSCECSSCALKVVRSLQGDPKGNFLQFSRHQVARLQSWS
jgi:hypothetical protein